MTARENTFPCPLRTLPSVRHACAASVSAGLLYAPRTDCAAAPRSFLPATRHDSVEYPNGTRLEYYPGPEASGEGVQLTVCGLSEARADSASAGACLLVCLVCLGALRVPGPR